MSTLSVPLNAELEEAIDILVKNGVGPNKAAVARKAIQILAEENAIEAVLQSEREVRSEKILKGDLKEISCALSS